MTNANGAPPTGAGPLRLRLAAERGAVRAGAAGLLRVLVALESDPPPGPAERPPLNVAAVLDRSGSMAGEKLEHCKRAAMFLVDHLTPRDRLAVVIYDDEVHTLVPSQPIVEKDLAKARIAAIVSGGSTNLSGGYLTGCSEVRRGLDAARSSADDGAGAGGATVNRVLLLTDGLANVGITDREALASLARREARTVTLTTIGVGHDFDEELLQAMADAGRGHYHYIASPEAIPGIFAEELQGLVAVVAQDVRLRVRPAGGAALRFIYGYPAVPDGAGAVLDLPDVYGAERKALVVGLDLPALPEGTWPVIEVELAYRDATAGAAPVTVRTALEVESTTDEARVAASLNAEVVKEATLQDAAQAQKRALELADAGRLDEAAETLGDQAAFMASVAHQLEAAGHHAAAAELRTEHGWVREQQAFFHGDWSPAARKAVHFSAYNLQRGRRDKAGGRTP